MIFMIIYLILDSNYDTNAKGLFGWNSSVPFPHTNGRFPSVSKRKEPSFYYGNGRRTERNRSNRTGPKKVEIVKFLCKV